MLQYALRPSLSEAAQGTPAPTGIDSMDRLRAMSADQLAAIAQSKSYFARQMVLGGLRQFLQVLQKL